MSHFLTHLVQRTLGEDSATVEPRPASRFESAAPAAPFAGTEAVAVDAAEHAAIGAPRGPRRRQGDNPPQAPADAGDSGTQLQALSLRLEELDNLLAGHRRSAPAARSPHMPSTARAGAGNAPGPAAWKEEGDGNAAPPAIGAAMSPARQSLAEPPERGLVAPAGPSQPERKVAAGHERDGRGKTPAAHENLRRGPGKGGIAIAPDLVSMASEAGPTRREQPPGERSEKRARGPAPAAAPRSVLAPQSARQSPMGHAAGRNGAVAETTPTINVTIGRIEVRAMPAPPPVVRKAARQGPAQPSAMSLDEYLRRRNGGTP